MFDFNFFNGKRVLVTGDTGFKGAWLCRWLSELKSDVFGLALPQSDNDFLYSHLHANHWTHFDTDVRDLAALKKMMVDIQPEIVFHLAAQSLVRESYRNPVVTFETNVMGGVNLIESLRTTPSVRALVYVTSDKCYLNKQTTKPYTEDSELGGRDPYSASKACAEIVFTSYLESFYNDGTLAAASARGGNVLGGGDFSKDRLIPDIVRALQSHTPIKLRNPEFTRPWQHVLDCLMGYLCLAQKLWSAPKAFHGSSWNIGPLENEALTVFDISKIFLKMWGGTGTTIETVPTELKEEMLLRLDITKALSTLPWKPLLSSQETIEWTAAWYKEVLHSKNADDMTIEQIEKFMNIKNFGLATQN